MKKLAILLLLGCLFFPSQDIYCQEEPDTTSMYSITMSNGNKFMGSIKSQNPTHIELSTNIGTLLLPRKDIKSIHIINENQIKQGRFWYPNLQATRYFFAPNGYGLKKGEAYYQNVWIFFNQFSVGIVDYFSIGAGFVPTFLFGGAPTPVWIVPKVSVPIIKDKLNFTIGNSVNNF